MPIVVPPVDEAEKIAAYIRVKEQQIRKLIRAKRRVIELLNEQKQAIIQLAVTRGLDPNVRLKPSGIEWLGEIPLHWRCVRAKQVAYVFIPQRDKPELNESSGLHWITPVNIGSRFVEPSGLYISHEVVALNGLRAVPPNSVIATCVGRFGITSINNAPVIINQQLQAYTPKASILSEFLRYCVECSRPYFEQEGNSTTLAYVDRAGFGNLPIPLPPQSEQLQIVERIRIEESELLHAVLRVTNEINLLREYRTRLIADVVTGKFDVRGVELPKLDEVEEVSDVEDEELEDSEELVAVEENVDAN
jgi:type I restriction enzyme S subunit